MSLLKHPEALKLKNSKDIEHVITIVLSCIISLLSMSSITPKSDEESKRNTLTHIYTESINEMMHEKIPTTVSNETITMWKQTYSAAATKVICICWSRKVDE